MTFTSYIEHIKCSISSCSYLKKGLLFDIFSRILTFSLLLWFGIPYGQRSAGDIMIRNIQLRHAGKYTCAVQTKVDSVSIATDVVVRGMAMLEHQ